MKLTGYLQVTRKGRCWEEETREDFLKGYIVDYGFYCSVRYYGASEHVAWVTIIHNCIKPFDSIDMKREHITLVVSYNFS